MSTPCTSDSRRNRRLVHILLGLGSVLSPTAVLLLVERADAASFFEPPAAATSPLAGPKLTDKESRPHTLIERDFDGKIKRLETSPEEAAVALLKLSPQERAAADLAIASRAADIDALVTDHLLDIVRIGGQFQADRPGDRAAAIREAYQLSGPILAKGRLIDRVSAALPETQRERYLALVDEYKKAVGDEEIRLARAGKSDDVEFSAEVNKNPTNLIGLRMRARVKLELESFVKEIQRSAERIIAEKQGKGDEFLSKLQLTPEQESKIQGIYADLAGKYGLKEPPKQVQAVLFVRVLGILTPEQRKQALVLIREQERQKELDANATKHSMDDGMKPMK